MKTIIVFAAVVLVSLSTILIARIIDKSQGARTPGPGRSGGGLSLWRILKRDWVARAITWPFVGIWALYLTFVFMGLPKLRIFSIVIAGMTVIAVPLLISKILFYRRMFAQGMEAAGRVTGISISDAWSGPSSSDDVTSKNIKCRIEYSYSFRDRAYSGRGVVVGSENTRGYSDMMDGALLKPGDEISLLVDPEKPGRSILRDLFASGSATLLHKHVDKLASLFPDGNIPRDEKSAREAIAALETRGKGNISMSKMVSASLVLCLISGFFFYGYFSYEPLKRDRFAEVTGHVRDWTAGRGDDATLQISTREHPYPFVVPDTLFKPGSYFDLASFQNEVKTGDELVFTIQKEDLRKTDEKRNVYALSSGSRTYLSMESAAAYDRKNHRWNLYVAFSSGLLTIFVTVFGMAGVIEDRKKRAKRMER